jgi:hypothetical protein
MMAYGTGDISVEDLVNSITISHTLKNVLYTPDDVKKLFLVPSSADKGVEYWLDKDRCQLLRNRKTIVERRETLWPL